jgi:hypothetical protein
MKLPFLKKIENVGICNHCAKILKRQGDWIMNDNYFFKTMDSYERNHVPLVVKTALSTTFQVPTHDIDQQ